MRLTHLLGIVLLGLITTGCLTSGRQNQGGQTAGLAGTHRAAGTNRVTVEIKEFNVNGQPIQDDQQARAMGNAFTIIQVNDRTKQTGAELSPLGRVAATPDAIKAITGAASPVANAPGVAAAVKDAVVKPTVKDAVSTVVPTELPSAASTADTTDEAPDGPSE